ncbi:MAG: hypothetical protein IKU34_03615 [Clostridia bacterium]|nr:hypothetical protein [Clostridia bacterium]
MNTSRTRVNGVSAAFSVAMVLTYLLAPFYSISLSGFSISGFRLIGLSPITIVPVLLGIFMTIGACLFPPLVAIIIESLTTLSVLVFMFMGNSIAATFVSSSLKLPPEWGIALNTTQSLLPTIQPSWGAIVALGLCIVALVIDILANISGRTEPSKLYIAGQDQNFDPFDSGF